MNRLQLLTSWSKAQTCVLLEELQKHPVIYDQTHPLHTFRSQRVAAYRMIIEKLRHVKPNMTAELIASKIRVLKCQYWKEKKDIKISLETKKPGTPAYKPKLWCFKLLAFFDKKGAYDMNEQALPEEECVEDEDENEDCYISESTSIAPSFEEVDLGTVELDEETKIIENSQTRSILQTKCLKLVEFLTKEMEAVQPDEVTDTVTINKQSPNTFLGLMVESELSKVTEEIYNDAKWKIIRILEEASKKNRQVKMHPLIPLIKSQF